MNYYVSRFADITEDIFESLDDESRVRCKDASRSLSFMNEDTELENTYLLDQDDKVDYIYEKLEKFDGSQKEQTTNA